MSLRNLFTKRRTIGGVIAMGLAALGISLALVAAPSGADYSASDTGRVDVSTATLSLNLSDPNGNTGTFHLNYGNVKPGDSVTKTFYVKNTGSIAANAKLGQPMSGLTVPSGLTAADFAELKVGVDGVQAPVSVTSMPASFNLGTVNPGQTKAVTVRVELSHSAGNEWQNKALGANVTVTLSQA